MKSLFPFLFILLLFSCGRTVYLNHSEHYKLILKSDSTYFFVLPAPIHRYSERGTYQIKNDSVLLTQRYENVYDSISGISTDITFSKEIDSVLFSFRNLNDTAVAVRFRINGNPAVFNTNRNGECKLAYHDLLAQKIIDSTYVFHSFDISFGDRQYHYEEKHESAGLPIGLPKSYSLQIRFQLNQFAGKKYAFSYRRYAFSRDSIIVNTSSWKGMPKDVVLKKKG